MYVCICKRVQCRHRQSIQSLNNPFFKFEFSLRDQILWRRVLLVGYIHSFSEFLKKGCTWPLDFCFNPKTEIYLDTEVWVVTVRPENHPWVHSPSEVTSQECCWGHAIVFMAFLRRGIFTLVAFMRPLSTVSFHTNNSRSVVESLCLFVVGANARRLVVQITYTSCTICVLPWSSLFKWSIICALSGQFFIIIL